MTRTAFRLLVLVLAACGSGGCAALTNPVADGIHAGDRFHYGYDFFELQTRSPRERRRIHSQQNV